ncbi:MAG TPA: zinc ribbon domain-containing protein [Anaerolineaceae bacterium]|nr:zinc ribbon domain-containing protein [Anaerolineaceae bacterium]HPN51145.1 zinc ribbon domain-containing protein [Anaerolineaceae bacterium]
MPIYEYICLDCKQKTEVIRSMKDADAPIACKHCHSEKTTRQMSRFAAHSGGQIVAGGGGGHCGSCSGGSCSGCGGH